ncbi:MULTISPECIES: DUF3237 domain-containing protein [Variovorax]|jgi:hypothetical protein|uniref:DUF3237 domain-containing protein n=1 Tax=Variovorax TaxID=34072 RepID=UPI00086B10CC|nr:MULTISPECIES: DUF3237 domain-containing protein [Variovorax]MBN8753092.1 DUF3237 domain-containing protein [Variovorax sp.]ODU11624.1 MAG: hypothetical protein ABS94_33225 [Variovorax sp. SCN 67-85]ODV15011.1 MAG: hypothetical protein ABT25_34720 [Variovorax sp. SCN 67-20]OJZ05269.1 MAG: hypothetical protein BGP22_10895 [Variovorax sp. 67-131]UKI05295.1 DUF3237 domain-containing protein [Variovorax paradoxus]
MSVFDFNAITAPSLEHFADLRVEVGTPQVLGGTPRGMRRVVPITGGEATGHGWRARVLPGGCDFQLIVSETLSELDARYALETDAGDLIYVQNQAVRSATPEVMAQLLRGEPVDPTQVYFRCNPRFETTSPSLKWISERMFTGAGMRKPAEVVMRFYTLV